MKQLQMLGYITLSESILSPAKVKINVDSLALYDFQLRHERFEPLIKYLLRAYGGIYDRYAIINPNKIAQAIGVNTAKVSELLKELDHQKILHFVQSSDTPMLTFLMGRQPKIFDREKWLTNLKKAAGERMKGMHSFVQSETCRSKLICRYFDEERKVDCEKCDVCQLKRRNAFSIETLKEISKQIEDAISGHPLNPKDLIEQLKHPHVEEVKDVLRWLIDDGKIEMNTERQLRWKN